MKPEFHEDYRDETHGDPLAPTHVDFPYDEVFDKLDGRDRTEAQLKLAQAIHRIFQWLTVARLAKTGAKVIGYRTIAIAWVLSPSMFQGHSLSTLAKRLGCSPDTLQRITAEVSREFGVRSRGQVHGWNWKQKGQPKTPAASPANQTPSDQLGRPPKRPSARGCVKPTNERPV